MHHVLCKVKSDRRAAIPVKEYAVRYPHCLDKRVPESMTHVAPMEDGNFYEHEK